LFISKFQKCLAGTDLFNLVSGPHPFVESFGIPRPFSNNLAAATVWHAQCSFLKHRILWPESRGESTSLYDGASDLGDSVKANERLEGQSHSWVTDTLRHYDLAANV
jgi:hypothetical protein